MLVPLYKTVYDHLDLTTGTWILSVGCGSGLALLMAASRGATVTGVEAGAERRALARVRLSSWHGWDGRSGGNRGEGAPPWPPPYPTGRSSRTHARGEVLATLPRPGRAGPFDVVTLFEGLGHLPDPEKQLIRIARLGSSGSPVVIAGWGPPEECRTAQVLHIAAQGSAEEWATTDPFRLNGPEEVAELVARAGLRPDGGGRVACPFAYPDMDSAVRGLRSTGLFEAAAKATDPTRVDKDLTEALGAFQLADGGVRMDNLFQYTIARVP